VSHGSQRSAKPHKATSRLNIPPVEADGFAGIERFARRAEKDSTGEAFCRSAEVQTSTKPESVQVVALTRIKKKKEVKIDRD